MHKKLSESAAATRAQLALPPAGVIGVACRQGREAKKRAPTFSIVSQVRDRAAEDALKERNLQRLEERRRLQLSQHDIKRLKSSGAIEALEQENKPLYRAQETFIGNLVGGVTLRQGFEVMVRSVAPEIVDIVDTTDHAAGEKPFYQRTV